MQRLSLVKLSLCGTTITVSKDASAPVTAIAYDNQNLTTLAAKFTTVTAGFKVTDVTVTVGASADTVVQNVMLRWRNSSRHGSFEYCDNRSILRSYFGKFQLLPTKF